MKIDWVRVGAVVMALAVVAGAFGAHALKATLTPAAMEIYKTAVLYHMIFGLTLFLIAWRVEVKDSGANLAGILIFSGILLFSGSLYALSLTGITAFGAVTPVGGLLFIAGCGILAG